MRSTPLGDEEIVITVGTMIAAAIQSTNLQLRSVVVALAQHPEQRAAVREDPARIIARPNEPHLGYRWGPHQCIGRPLARLTMRVTFEELLPALGDYALAPGEAARTRNPNLRGFQRLPIRF